MVCLMADDPVLGYSDTIQLTPGELAREAIHGAPSTAFHVAAETNIDLAKVTPEELISKMGQSLSTIEGPIPAGQALNVLEKIYNFKTNTPFGLIDNFQDATGQALFPHLFNDAQLDREEIVATVAALVHKFSPVVPDKDIIVQSQKMLTDLGISDTDGTLATGIAKASVMGAVGLQYYMGKASDMFEQAMPIPENAHGQEETIIEQNTLTPTPPASTVAPPPPPG